jgi:1,4-dihydroxy-2-naphthoyl-CoA synthase
MCVRKRKERVSVSYNTILYGEAHGIVTITLNRAEKRNVISYELTDKLRFRKPPDAMIQMPAGIAKKQRW